MTFEAKCRFIRAAVMRYGFTEDSFGETGSPDIEGDIETLNDNLDAQIWINLSHDDRMDVEIRTSKDIWYLLDEMEDDIQEAVKEVWEHYLEYETFKNADEMNKRIHERLTNQLFIAEMDGLHKGTTINRFIIKMTEIADWYRERYPHYFK